MRRGISFLVLIALLLGAGWVLYKAKHLETQHQQPALSASPLPQTDQQRLQSALNGTGLVPPSGVLTAGFAAALHGGRVLPAGATITLQPDTFRSSGNYGIVNAVVAKPGSQSALVALLLARQDSGGLWLIDTLLPSIAKTAYAANAGSGTVPNRAEAPTGCESPVKNVPVLFVHGFNEKPGNWGSLGQSDTMLGVVNGIQGVTPNLLDYSSANLQWVTSPLIGPSLANRILCLSQSSRAEGGSGKVIVVAHSMGGLALKEAIREQPQIASMLGLVVTIGTPNDGSTMDTNVTQAILDLCNLAQATGSPLGVSCTAGTIAALNAFTALPGLRAGSPELKALPNWPAGVPVYAIAGNIATRHLVLLWDGPVPHFQSAQGNFSGQDTLVTVGSALHGQIVNGLGGTREFKCTTDVPWVLPFGLTAADCEHNALLRNGGVESAVADEIRMYLAASRYRPAPPAPTPQPAAVVCAQTFNARAWQNATVHTTIQHGNVTCGQAVDTVRQFLGSDIGSSGANQIGSWDCVTQYKPPAKIAGMCSGQHGEFTFTGT